MAGPLAGSLIQDSGGRYFQGPVNPSGEVGLAWRARNVSGNLAAGEVVLYDAAGNPLLTASAALADGLANPTTSIIGGAGLRFNETGWDRERGNTSTTILASAARTATTASGTLTNYNARGVQLDIGVTAKAGTTTLTARILDGTGGSVVSAGPAFAANAGQPYSMQFYPGVITTDFGITGSGKSIAIPRSFMVQIVHSDASSITYSVICHFIA